MTALLLIPVAKVNSPGKARHKRSIHEKSAARTCWIREIGRKVGKWIVAKVAQLTFPSHFSRLILGSLRTSYSRPSACLSVCLLHFHFTATANGAVPISGTVNFNAQRFPYNIIKHNEYAFTCIFSHYTFLSYIKTFAHGHYFARRGRKRSSSWAPNISHEM